MKRVTVAVVVVALVLLAGCGGKKSSSTTVTITLSPAAASVNLSATQQFTATITNSTNTAVTWQVNGVVGGNQTVGFISTTGLYTAPNAVPTPATVTITAISQADTTQTATATVTITTSTTTNPLIVSPNPVTLAAGGQQQFTATQNGSAVAVNWTVNCASQVAGACGSVNASGVFTAPLSPPPGGTLTVTATPQAAGGPPAAGAVVTVQIGNGTFNGKYAFTFRGQGSSGNSYIAGGSITFDGLGNVTGGVEDVNTGGSVTQLTIASGTYNVGTDGRGNVQLTTNPGNVVTNWRVTAVNHSKIYVILFNNAVPIASGILELQDGTQFNLTGFNGAYSFNVSGADSSNKPGSMAGAGALNSNGATVLTGVQDINSSGTANLGLSIGGNYGVPDASGRGTMTLTGTSYAYYIVDATHIKMVSLSTTAQLVGDAYKQPSGPFTASNFTGSIAFAFLGSNTVRGVSGEGGVLTLSGTGTTGSVSSGTMDLNAGGNVLIAGQPVSTGSYTVQDGVTGRTTMSVTVGGSTLQYAIYPQANGAFSMVEIDTNVMAGRALAQSGGFNSGTFLGQYAFNLSGSDFIVNPGEEDLVGEVIPNGGSTMSGTVAINDNGTLTSSANASTSAPGYTVASNGRGSLPFAVNSGAFGTLTLYVVDSNTALFLETDNSRVMVGIAQKQF